MRLRQRTIKFAEGGQLDTELQVQYANTLDWETVPHVIQEIPYAQYKSDPYGTIASLNKEVRDVSD